MMSVLDGAQAVSTIIRYGGVADSHQDVSPPVAPDMRISFQGETGGLVTNASPFAGTLSPGTGSTLTDPISGLVLTVDGVSSNSTLSMYAPGHFLGVTGGGHDFRIDEGEFISISFSQDIIVHYIGLFTYASEWLVLGTEGQFALNGEVTSFTCPSTFNERINTLVPPSGGNVLLAGQALELSTLSPGGGWSLGYLSSCNRSVDSFACQQEGAPDVSILHKGEQGAGDGFIIIQCNKFIKSTYNDRAHGGY